MTQPNTSQSKAVEAMRRALSFIDGTVEPWADHHYRQEAEDAIRVLGQEGFVVAPTAWQQALEELAANQHSFHRPAGRIAREALDA
jgi:hypothetical protein